MGETMAEPSNEREWLITDLEAARHGPAIVDLLRSIPATWAELDLDKLTSLQEGSLFYLIAAGMVERGGWLRSTMANHPTVLEVRFQATGEYGFVEALDHAASVAYQTWRDAWRAWREEEKEGASPFHVYSVKPQEWRLTDQGELARDELNAADGRADVDNVVNFVLKRGLYGPGYWHRRGIQNHPPSASEQRAIERELAAGRELDELPRPPVPGSGKILEIRRSEQTADAAEVNIANWKAGAESFAAMLATFFEAKQSPSTSSEPEAEEPAPTSATEDATTPTLTPFQEGEMAFWEDRVTLCGVDICSGRGSERQRAVLDLLRVKREDGQFASYSGKDLVEKVELIKDSTAAAGVIRDLRDQISKCLREQVGINCGRRDVILSGDQGYRFSEKLSVQDAQGSRGAGLQAHGIGIAAGSDPSHEPGDTNRDQAHEPDSEPDREPATGIRASPMARQKWILDELGKGRKLQRPDIIEELKCSRETARRDLNALKDAGRIEYFGSSRSGYYRLIEDE
jgi:hypothetical protein